MGAQQTNPQAIRPGGEDQNLLDSKTVDPKRKLLFQKEKKKIFSSIFLLLSNFHYGFFLLYLFNSINIFLPYIGFLSHFYHLPLFNFSNFSFYSLPFPTSYICKSVTIKFYKSLDSSFHIIPVEFFSIISGGKLVNTCYMSIFDLAIL